MYNQELASKLRSFFKEKKHLVVVQGDNPDADSLASSLAIEEIMHQHGVSTSLYCSVDVSQHLRYLSGWDRVTHSLPTEFDGWILVDCEFMSLIENIKEVGDLEKLKKRPLLIIDHHDSPSDIDFAEVVVNDIQAGATGVVIYEIAKMLEWNITPVAAEMLCVSILADTLGFTSASLDNNSRPVRVLADLIDKGVKLGELNEKRIRQNQINKDTFLYKAKLMQRIEFHFNDRIATVDIPHDEIREFSKDYNPTVVLDDTRMITGLAVTIGFKCYERNGLVIKVTGRIRCGFGYSFARELASLYEDGGGHPFAAGFKITGNDLDLKEIKRSLIQKSIELIQKQDEAV